MLRNQVSRIAALTGLILITSTGWISAQSTAEPGFGPDLNYSSVFDNYVPFDFVPPIDWRKANDLAGEFGGWRAYLNLVQEERNDSSAGNDKDSDK